MDCPAWLVAPYIAKQSTTSIEHTRFLSKSISLPSSSTRRVSGRSEFAVKMTLREPKQSKLPANTWVGEHIEPENLIRNVRFNDAGLVPAIAQQWDTSEVLMMAWMNEESIRATMRGGRAVYYSRSRKELWRKGDTSGQIQVLRDVLLDCDGDTILLKVDQLGVACHTGRRSCFYKAFRPPKGDEEIIAEVSMDPRELYKSK
ncbi:Phosphoribosyl-AMP cyclohydrolase [Gracilariopsis chorda]|uniref:Histidine biosynthesis bifunctional protein HisIE n=1 Tax=Gracilariopsis chorda TaxID=448386 RepID=A0A2V3J316_9FLOR|nr:Phosphoribosyl-AMP cyclohydrolase [Gracilariopsis chorda]|eukprot:PXF48769.1 Phosphoribosyl-AMP cyclohydrolase [Gracilariopsis chorda]